jgi:hypothetical protein
MKCNGIEELEAAFILDSTALHRGYLLGANVDLASLVNGANLIFGTNIEGTGGGIAR